jgi:hypothetical protein
MRTRILFVVCAVLAVSTLFVTPSHCQQDASPAQSASEPTVEGTVVSVSRTTLVIRTDDGQYHLFTYDRPSVRSQAVVAGARVRVTAGPADENGRRSASEVAVLTAVPSGSVDKGAKAAPVPEKVHEVEGDIRRESRRWNLGVRAGGAFDPELFFFGVLSQIGPIFHPRVFFRPNAEFAFGEVTDLVALNFEMAYRFPGSWRKGNWTPYVGAGPAMIFLHQSFQQGRQIDFGNFDYKTGFNVLIGAQHRRGTFLELKTSLYSGRAPKLRAVVGYTF